MRDAAKPDGVDAMMQDLLTLIGENRDKLIAAWSQGAESYARYLTALAQARSPEDVVAANAEFARETIEAFTESADPGAHLDGGSHPPLQLAPLPE